MIVPQLFVFIAVLTLPITGFDLFYTPPEYACPPNNFGFDDEGANCSILYEPLHIIGSKVYLGGDNNSRVEFPIRGMGYSPVPPGTDLSMPPSGDYFLSKYYGIWDRDLPLMLTTNATTIRVWSWNFIEDHTHFLETIWQKCRCAPLRVLVPFMLSFKVYGELEFPARRNQALLDYDNFLTRYKDFPSIFAYMIGNEVNIDYIDQIQFVMSLVNDMIQLKRSRGINVPLTLPLAADSSFEVLLDRYYEMIELDFWSVQVYDLHRLEEVISFYRNRTAANPKPLLVTEFGVDAMGSRTYESYENPDLLEVNETNQANGLDKFWRIIEANSDIVLGGFVMEYVDEWWKGNYPFASNRNESCPNLRADKQNYCGSVITNETFLNEEWLGIFEQKKDEYLISQSIYCIKPRKAFYTIASWWSTKNATLEFEEYCAFVGLHSSLFYLVSPLVFLILLLIVVETRFNCRIGVRKKRKSMDVIDRTEHAAASQYDSQEEKKKEMEVLNTIDVPALKRFLTEMITGVFYKFCTDLNTFEVAKLRVKTLIWDRIYSSKEALASAKEASHQYLSVLDSDAEANMKMMRTISRDDPNAVVDQPPVRAIKKFSDMSEPEKQVFIRCVSEVYNRYLEAYLLWKQNCLKKKVKFVKTAVRDEQNCEKQLNDIILWNMVAQCAATISHAPEKICQVFYFTKRFIKAKKLQLNFEHNREAQSGMAPPDLAASLMKIFKTYYEDVKTKHINYDDMNFDGQRNMNVKNIKDLESALTLHDAFFLALHPDKVSKEQNPDKENEPTRSPRGNTQSRLPVVKIEEDKQPITQDVEGKAEDEKRKSRLSHQPKLNRHSTILLDVDRVPRKTIQYDKMGTIKLVHVESKINISQDMGDLSKFYKLDKKSESATTVQKYFPNLGGILGCLVFFGWLLRLNSWLIILSRYCGNGTICWQSDLALQDDLFSNSRKDLYFQLAFMDSGLGLAINAFRFFVVGVKNVLIVEYVKLVWHAGGFVAMLLIQLGFLGLDDSLILIIMMLYLIVTVIMALVTEIYLNLKRCAYTMPGRNDTVMCSRYVVAGFMFGTILMAVAYLAISFMSTLNAGADIVFLTSVFGFKIRGMTILFAFLSFVFGFSFALMFGNLRIKTAVKSASLAAKLKNVVFRDTMFQFRQLVFWFIVFAIQWVFLIHILMPAVDKVDADVCACKNEKFQTTDSMADQCEDRYLVMCWVALVLMWGSTILIAFVSLNSAFTIVLLLAGIFSAIQQRVGNVQRWAEVATFFNTIRSKCFSVISSVMKDNPWYQINFWNEFIDSLYEDFLLSKAERERLKYHNGGRRKPVFKPPPVNKEAQRRIIKFCWSLEAMYKASQSNIPDYRKQNMVRSMPAWTIMIPCHSETCVYMQADLLRPKTGRPRISTVEYVAATYSDEWANFSRFLRSNSEAGSPEELLDDFLNTPVLKGDEPDSDIPVKGRCTQYEVDQICFFVSYRGQTLVRTMKGMFNYRKALEKLAMMEEGVWFMADREEQSRKTEEIQKMVKKKFQIILAYQIYARNTSKVGWTEEKKASFEMMLTKFHDFDMAFPEEITKEVNGEQIKQFNSSMIRFLRNGNKKEYSIERPGELVIGEPKAENQHHALAFALNGVLQVNDMNMYTSLENGFKTPFMLHSFFNTPDNWEDPSMVIPKFRCVGYPEYTYTRTLSTVGDLMGSAEFCFVTIMQRVLGFLRVRCHYGHPDFFDGFWVRTRGGVSKASHLINTNEDIFSGYEMLGRGEKIKYIEYIEQEKGRESAFDNAFIFEAKLAKGAAQQIKSPHVYYLNENLPMLTRLSLFFGSIGFYITTMLMCVTIDFYIFTVVLFLASGTTYHVLGLLDGVIAVPWIIQIGYVQALPLLLELSIEQGIMDGILLFIRRLVIGLIFFVFHVRTKSYFFGQGLFSGKGGYMATGRGFGLDRRNLLDLYKLYFDSHFNNAIILLLACFVYIPVSGDDSAPILLRLLSVLLVVFSWLVAPIMFNPYPTRESHREDVDAMIEWIRSSPDMGKKEIRSVILANASKTEAERKKKINEWWAGKESTSWKAYFIKGTIDEWEAEDNLFRRPLEKIVLFIQKVVFLLWKFLPWIILCLPSWHYESLYYLFYILLCIGVSLFIDRRYGEQHEYFTFMKISMFLIIAPLATVLYNAQISLNELIVSLCLYTIIIYALVTEIYLGFYNNVIIKRMKVKETYQAFPERIKISGFFYEFQKIWPFISVTIMTIVNLGTVWLCSTLTTMLYNGAVADKWNRAHMMIKQQRQYFDPAMFGVSASRSNSISAPEGHESMIVDLAGSSSNSPDVLRLDGMSMEVMDHIEEMQKKMNMMQEQMRRNMELMLKSRNHAQQGSFINSNEPSMPYEQIKAEIEIKTRTLMDGNLPEKEKDAINIDLERLFIMLENTQEYKDEKLIAAQEKRAKNEPIDKKCLESMRAKYSPENMSVNPDLAERYKSIATLKLITADTVDIVKKHANDWKFLTLNGLSVEELRAIRANLPQFARTQTRQLQWCQRLDDIIDKLEISPANKEDKKPVQPTKRITFAAHILASKGGGSALANKGAATGNAFANKSSLMEQIKNRNPHPDE